MRVKEEFKKSGKFWLPSTPEHQIAGTLTISEGGHIELEIIEALHSNRGEAFNTDTFARIIGHIENGEFVTLDDCFYKFKSFGFHQISKSLICANKAFIGVGYDEGEAVSFNAVDFSVEGTDEWVGISGIGVEYQIEKAVATIHYEMPEEISTNLDNGMQLFITFSSSLPSPTVKGVEITQRTYFKLVCHEAKTIDEFISVIHKITTFLCFGIDKIVCLDSLEATSNSLYQEFGDIKRNIPVKIYHSSLPYCEHEAKIYPQRMLFTFGQIKDNFEKMVNRWIDAYDKIDVVFSLYFSTKMEHQKYFDGKFLALVQGLETYHRRICTEKLMSDDSFNNLKKLVKDAVAQCSEKQHKEWLSSKLHNGNEIYLGKRLEMIIEPFKELIGNEEQREQIIKDIKNTRNYLTHYDESLETKAVHGIDLYYLCLKMEAIFQLHFLHVLGFTVDEVKFIFDNSYELRHKLQTINVFTVKPLSNLKEAE